MVQRFQLFLRGLATNWTGTTGVVLTTSAFLLFVFMELLRISGIITNSYVGLLTYMILPLLFMVGLVLIPIGWRKFRRVSGKSLDEMLHDRFPDDMVRSRGLGSNLIGLIAVLTVVNVMFFGLGGARMLHFMDGPEFCGTACHKVMNPEWVAYQNSPHAHVRCIDCHVGEGAGALIDAKLNGLWQIVSATFDLYERPIPTPVHNLRPARETCEKCHWPDKFYGERIKRMTRFDFDETSAPRYTTLALKVGSGTGAESGTIHWHIAATNEVRYQAIDEKRLTMAWVEVRKGDEFHRYVNVKLAADALPDTTRSASWPAPRSVDCVDCHNRATHIYQEPEPAVDAALAAGRIDRLLPYAKKVALGALLGAYADKDAALLGIDNEVRGYYQREQPQTFVTHGRQLDAMVTELQAIYARNIHPTMNIGWNSYASHIGHRHQAGCFRCHNQNLVDERGQTIPYDCTLCHSILAYDSATPFQFLTQPDEQDPDRKMHLYLQSEFLESVP